MYREYKDSDDIKAEETSIENEEITKNESIEEKEVEKAKPSKANETTVKYKIPFMKVIAISVIAAMVGGLFTAYIAPTYLYGKIIKDPYSNIYMQGGPAL